MGKAESRAQATYGYLSDGSLGTKVIYESLLCAVRNLSSLVKGAWLVLGISKGSWRGSVRHHA